MPIESGATQAIDLKAVQAQMAAEAAKKEGGEGNVINLATERAKRAPETPKTEILSVDERYELMRTVDEVAPMAGEMRAMFDKQRDEALAEANALSAKVDDILHHSQNPDELLAIDQLQVQEQSKRDSAETLIRLSENLRDLEDMASLATLPPKQARAQILKMINSLHAAERLFQGRAKYLGEHPTPVSQGEIQQLDGKRAKVSGLLNKLRSARDKYADHISASSSQTIQAKAAVA